MLNSARSSSQLLQKSGVYAVYQCGVACGFAVSIRFEILVAISGHLQGPPDSFRTNLSMLKSARSSSQLLQKSGVYVVYQCGVVCGFVVSIRLEIHYSDLGPFARAMIQAAGFIPNKSVYAEISSLQFSASKCTKVGSTI